MGTMNRSNPMSAFNEDFSPESAQAAGVVMAAISALSLMMAFAGAVKVLYLHLVTSTEASSTDFFAQLIALGLMFLMGWAAGFLSINNLDNTFHPIVIRIFGFCVSFGMAGIYILGMVDLYNENAISFLKYIFVFLVSYFALAAFHVMTEKAHLNLMVFPLSAVMAIHIVLILFHYVFWGANEPKFIFSDLGLLGIAIVLMSSMGSANNAKGTRKLVRDSFFPSKRRQY